MRTQSMLNSYEKSFLTTKQSEINKLPVLKQTASPFKASSNELKPDVASKVMFSNSMNQSIQSFNPDADQIFKSSNHSFTARNCLNKVSHFVKKPSAEFVSQSKEC